MTNTFTKLASMVSAFALLTAIAPVSVYAAPAVDAEEFVTVDGSYKGISVGFRTTDITNATAVTVTLNRADGSSVTKTANAGVLGIINSPGTNQLTTPFVIKEGSFTEAGDTLYWNPAPAAWSVDTRPVSVTITVSTADGDLVTTNSSFNEGGSWPTWESIVPGVTAENFNTHSGTDYKGINVGFRVTNMANLDDVTVELRDANGDEIVTNTGVAAKLNPLLVNGAAQLSTPFITQNLTYGTEEYWTLGEWKSYAKPSTAVITVNGIEVENTTLSEQHAWESIIPAVNAENFNTHAGTDYTGINVGFNVSNISTFTELTVELQDASGNTLAVNEGNLAKLNELLAQNTTQFSTPFITQNLTYGTEEYWTLGEWESAEKPAKAIITVNGIVAENTTLSEQHDWATIAPVIAQPEDDNNGGSSGRSGSSRRTVNTNSNANANASVTGQVNSVTPGQGQVLGASTYNFTVDLWYGKTGADVNALQQMLIDAGLLAIPAPTGWFGPMTQAALKQWQATHGVPSTGYFGPLTRAAVAATMTAQTTGTTTPAN
ncbi:MAG TPA: peptidoglycan-binding domain-containing protein [Candidatus Paceibacterota bacterium]